MMEVASTVRDASHKGNHTQQQYGEKSYEKYLEQDKEFEHIFWPQCKVVT